MLGMLDSAVKHSRIRRENAERARNKSRPCRSSPEPDLSQDLSDDDDGITVIRCDDVHASDGCEGSDADEASCLSYNRAAADEPGPAKAPYPEAKGAGKRAGRRAGRAGVGKGRPAVTGSIRCGALLRSLSSLCHRNEQKSILLVRVVVGAWLLVIALVLLNVANTEHRPRSDITSYQGFGKGAESRLAEEKRLQDEMAALLGRVAGVAPPPPLWPQA
jgi:hypothetical protein